VHLNVPFREPVDPIPVSDDFPEGGWTEELSSRNGMPDGRPYLSVSRSHLRADSEALRALSRELESRPRGIIICGPNDGAFGDSSFADALSALANRLGYPLLADPLSQVRCGSHDKSLVIDSYDIFLRDEEVAEALRPDVILRFGAMTSSKPLMLYLRENRQARQVLVDPGGWRDPFHASTDRVAADETVFCRDLAEVMGGNRRKGEWKELWRSVAAKTRDAVVERVGKLGGLFEGRVFQELSELLPDGSTLLAANSMPVRDLDAFFPTGQKRIGFLGNRGINGIDGLVSTALGAATRCQPLVAVLGDTAFYHDLNGLLAAQRHGIRATFIVLNNDGGGIFSFLPQAKDRETLDPLFAMPHGLTFHPAAELYGLEYGLVKSWAEYREAVQRGLSGAKTCVIEVPGEREENLKLHEDVWSAGKAAARRFLEDRSRM
jgi:2-succinyl-5-enolpyruvyl-6-hydroxy-3-cyclohexene-1-carboxylate synthase